MKLQYRFLLPTIIVIALVLSSFATLLMNLSFQAQLSGERKSLRDRARSVTYITQSAYANYALQGIMPDEEQTYALATTQGEDIALENIDAPIPERLWLDGQTLRAEKAFQLSDSWYRLTLASDLSEVYALRALLLRYYHIAYLAAVILVSGVLLLIVRYVTKPLAELTRVSLELTNGNLDARPRICSKDEIGALAASLSGMADAVTDQITRQTRFINNLTHEMKTPLTSMIGHADNLRSGRVSGDDALITAQTIFREGKRLDALSTAMTEWILLKRDAPVMNSLYTLRLFEEITTAFVISEESRIQISSDSRNIELHGDHALISAMLGNLVRNALTAGATEIRLNSEVIDAYAARIVVSDNGCGMTEDELSHIVEPFYRVDKARSRANGGAGLGLALCKEIVTLHRGILRFESKPCQGTRAIIEIKGKAVDEID